MYATENYPPLLVGRSCWPKCFGGMEATEFGVMYDSRGKGWMNSNIFARWLRGFDDYIGSARERKILLLIDNCSAHEKPDTFPELCDVLI